MLLKDTSAETGTNTNINKSLARVHCRERPVLYTAGETEDAARSCLIQWCRRLHATWTLVYATAKPRRLRATIWLQGMTGERGVEYWLHGRAEIDSGNVVYNKNKFGVKLHHLECFT